MAYIIAASSSVTPLCSSMAAVGTLNQRILQPSARQSMVVSLKQRRASWRPLSVSAEAGEGASVMEAPAKALPPAISLSSKAREYLIKMKAEKKQDLCLRIGVRQGGCSGMSYVMEFEDAANIKPEESRIDDGGVTLVCDPKSLLYLFGMELDYSDALIGGGFAFHNPNASNACGCGKSFSA